MSVISSDDHLLLTIKTLEINKKNTLLTNYKVICPETII